MMNLDIIYEDSQMIICNKPAGVLAQSGRSFDVDMVSALMTYRRKQGEPPFIGVVNRLDRPVSGLMVFGKSPADTAGLNALMQKNTFQKQYYALVRNQGDALSKLTQQADQAQQVIQNGATSQRLHFTDYLLKDGKSNTSVVVPEGTKDAKKAELELELVAAKQDIALVRIHLLTGRHHQIRVQLASRGIPILGDVKYAAGLEQNAQEAGIGRNQIALCAYSLDIGDRHYEVECPFEEYVKLLLEK